MEMINVLWVNNGKDVHSSFLSDANEHGIKICTCYSMKECRAHLENRSAEHWDAVILNCDARLDCEEPDVDKFGYAIDQIKVDNPMTPYFVVTENKLEPLDEIYVKGAIGNKKANIYCLADTESSLFEDIKNGVCESPDRIVREKYAHVCRLCNNRQELIDILKEYECNQKELQRDYTVPNNCRKILESLTNSDLFNGVCEVLNASGFFKDDRHKFAPALVSAVLEKYKEAVPSYVRRSFHFCTEVGNDGSHEASELATNTLIQNGEAPYLNLSLVANLLNVLHWLNLHVEKNDFDALMIKAGENYLKNQNTKR